MPRPHIMRAFVYSIYLETEKAFKQPLFPFTQLINRVIYIVDGTNKRIRITASLSYIEYFEVSDIFLDPRFDDLGHIGRKA